MASQTSDSAVASTLHRLTVKKLEKLEVHTEKFLADRESIKSSTLHQAGSLDKQIRTLLDGTERCNATLSQTGLSAKNIKRFLDQAQRDPNVSSAVLKQWKQRLEQNLDMHALKYEYAGLFGKLVTEWMQSTNEAQPAHQSKEGEALTRVSSSSTASVSSDFEQVGREEMHEQRKQWEEYTLSPRQTDPAAIKKYLDDLCKLMDKSKAGEKSPLEKMQKTFKEMSDCLPTRFTSSEVKSCIQAILKADLFADAKRNALVSLLDREDTLGEIADVLNMDLEALDNWQWSTQPVLLHMRRQLNGKYRVFMDEELHEAIFLQFMGTRLAISAKRAFTEVFKSKAWSKGSTNGLTRKDRDRRKYFLAEDSGMVYRSTIKHDRRETYADNYFMTQLPDRFAKPSRSYNEDDESENSEWPQPQLVNNGKQYILRLITTEMLINKKVHGEFTILQSDFKWFGPGLPHSTILTVLEFLELDPRWITFIKKFLSAPLAFASDGPNAQASLRQRGIPMSHILSDTLGELVLFFLDVAVNQHTDGGNIYRLHDDLWFWGQAEACSQAWKAMREFSTVMGMDLNMEKTGSASFLGNSLKTAKESKPDLPNGPIRWGLLELDVETGGWLGSREKLDEHVVEVQRQLSACRSIFAWVQAYNSYVDRFFSNNLGQPARCLGREHVQTLLRFYERLHQALFPSSKGSVTEHLRAMIKERFGVEDVPDGFFYFPIELGGLELHDPFVPMLSQLEFPHVDPVTRIENAYDEEQEAYESAKERFDRGETMHTGSNFVPENSDTFYTFKEHTRFMEETSAHLRTAYIRLLGNSSGDAVESTPEIDVALSKLPHDLEFSDKKFSRNWHSLSNYWKWIMELYGADVMKRFGGITMGERGLIPVGLVKMLRSEKVRWQS